MREELSRSTVVGGVRVDAAIQQVEDELSKWQCNKYLAALKRPHQWTRVTSEALFFKQSL